MTNCDFCHERPIHIKKRRLCKPCYVAERKLGLESPPLGPNIFVRLLRSTTKRLDKARGKLPRSTFIRELVEKHLPPEK